MTELVVSGLFNYPIKSCAGTALSEAQLTATGLRNDRRWMLVNEHGSFVTQRELGNMALITPTVAGDGLHIDAPGMTSLKVSGTSQAAPCAVTVWKDQCNAYDEGEEAAAWFSAFLSQPVRLVRFADDQQRVSSRDWTGDIAALNQFTDGFPVLVISTASLADLNSRLATALPMNRFRPNLVIDGLPAYGEDKVHELSIGDIRLRIVKPCTRCKITTTDQATGIAQGPEPLNTLRGYRLDKALRGVTFGQNAIIIAGVGSRLRRGQTVTARLRES
jgi:uncharacterized protein YcbX